MKVEEYVEEIGKAEDLAQLNLVLENAIEDDDLTDVHYRHIHEAYMSGLTKLSGNSCVYRTNAG